MPCLYPLPASRNRSTGDISLNGAPRHRTPHYQQLELSCGGCLGCRADHAKAWTLRNNLELTQQGTSCWTTLTYDDEHLPLTLSKRHYQLFIKRLRDHVNRRLTTRPIRHFGCGEYGSQGARPHYHAIIYGLSARESQLIDDCWQMGRTRTYAAEPRNIAYTAGYTAKKIDFRMKDREIIDLATGEITTWTAPFLQMSRRPGIGGHARAWINSWKTHAVMDGVPTKVPRFLHEAWKNTATKEEIDEIIKQKHERALTQRAHYRGTREEMLNAARAIATKEWQMKHERLTLD